MVTRGSQSLACTGDFPYTSSREAYISLWYDASPGSKCSLARCPTRTRAETMILQCAKLTHESEGSLAANGQTYLPFASFMKPESARIAALLVNCEPQFRNSVDR